MRQLKQFLRKRKADMLWCGDCECRTLKCWREANCICDDNASPVPPTPTPTTYTVTITANDSDMGSVDTRELIVEEGTSITTNNNVLTIDTVNITATAVAWYNFSAWTDSNWNALPATITWDLSILAVFETAAENFTITVDAIDMPEWTTVLLGTWESEEQEEITLPYDIEVPWWETVTGTANLGGAVDWSSYNIDFILPEWVEAEWTWESNPAELDEYWNFYDISFDNTFTAVFTEPGD